MNIYLTPVWQILELQRIPLLSSSFSTGSSALITNFNQQLYNTRLDSTGFLTQLPVHLRSLLICYIAISIVTLLLCCNTNPLLCHQTVTLLWKCNKLIVTQQGLLRNYGNAIWRIDHVTKENLTCHNILIKVQCKADTICLLHQYLRTLTRLVK
jgi:hypothetical protein